MTDISAHSIQLQQFIRQKNTVAAFIGAGCSKVLDIPIWDDLLIALNEEFGYYRTKQDVLDAIKRDDYYDVASYIESKAADKALYKEILKRYSKPRTCHFTSLHLEIVRLADIILTTNYDRSFEEALNALKRLMDGKPQDVVDSFKYSSFPVGDFRTMGIKENRRIYHLHGDAEEGEFVLTSQSYLEQYENPASDLTTLITSAYKELHLIFIGFSFNDKYLVKYLLYIRDLLDQLPQGKKPLRPHFCIISDSLIQDYFKPGDLVDMSITNAQELVDAGIFRLEEQDRDARFYFVPDSAKLIGESTYSDAFKQLLLSKIDDFEKAIDKREMFDRLGILPITFEGRNYLEIELILRRILEPSAAKPIEKNYVPTLI